MAPISIPTPVTPITPINPVSPVSPAPVALSPANPSVTTTAPTASVAVTVPNTSGTARFSLVVTDNLGVESAPVYATVNIQAPPTAVLTATPAAVAAGRTIELSGTGSTSSGSIVSYTFSLVPAV